MVEGWDNKLLSDDTQTAMMLLCNVYTSLVSDLRIDSLFQVEAHCVAAASTVPQACMKRIPTTSQSFTPNCEPITFKCSFVPMITARKELSTAYMASISFQILSDLHLETPAARPTYSDFSFYNNSSCLVLLGDIGHVSDSRLYAFLETQLSRFDIIFYVLGNHESYGGTLEAAKKSLREYESRKSSTGNKQGKFVVLDQTRYDISPTVTILGCNLFSAIDPDQASSIQLFSSDFEQIQDSSIDSHTAAHKSDLAWLNQQVAGITQNEPERQIVIFTHYSPTVQGEANKPSHLKDDTGVRTAVMTDLCQEPCWTSSSVVLWAFGHTHFNCDFIDSATGKRVLTNQYGGRRSEAEGFDAEKVVDVTTEQSTTAEPIEKKMGKAKRLLKLFGQGD